MPDHIASGGGGGGEEPLPEEEKTKVGRQSAAETTMSRKDKRKEAKKQKRKQQRQEAAAKEREEEEAHMNNPEEQARLRLLEEEEAQKAERARKEFEERERLWIEAMEMKKKEEEEQRRKTMEDLEREKVKNDNDLNEDDEWEYVEEGPAEIIWQGNEIIVKKKKVRVAKKDVEHQNRKEDTDRPTSNPLPPQSEAFADYKNSSAVSAQPVFENVAQQIPNFGTEQDKAHCPFHIKTGACRFGQRCSRVHFYPDKSCTLLIKNMYNGPGLAWEQDEGLEYTDDEVEHCYEEFYEDVHTEFLKFGEIVNFKVCRNGSFHLRGNVYVHYKSLDSAVLAYHYINGRFFAGKQVKCEFVGVTRWKVAICGEYMKSRLKTCSHGTVCNFIHCFRNPGGDYEWADWDKPPPKYWVEKMAALFGISDESEYNKQMEPDGLGQLKNSSRAITAHANRYHSRRSRSREMNYLNKRNSRSLYDEKDVWKSKRNSDGRKRRYHEKTSFEDSEHSKYRTHDTDSDEDWSIKDESKDGPRNHAWNSSKPWNEVIEFRDNSGDSMNGIHKFDSGREWLDREDGGGEHHGQTSQSSGDRFSHAPDNLRESKSRIHEYGSGGDCSDKEGDRLTCHKRKSSNHRNKTLETLDDHGDENKSCESDSDLSDRDSIRDRSHGHTRKSSRNRSKTSRFPDEDGNSKKKAYDTASNVGWLDRDRDGERHHSHKKSSSKDREEIFGFPYEHGHRKKRRHDGDTNEDWLDRERGRHHSRKRKHARKLMSENSWTPENLKYVLLDSEFNRDRSGMENILKRGHSRSRDFTGGEISKEGILDEDLKSFGHELESSDGSDERSKSHEKDARFNSDENPEKIGNWKSGYGTSKKHHK